MMTTLAELKPLIPILKYASVIIGDDACNDFAVDNTAESRALWRKIEEWSDPDDEGEWTLNEPNTTDKKIYFADSVALDYLIHLIEDAKP